jgi:hypothetical protein
MSTRSSHARNHRRSSLLPIIGVLTVGIVALVAAVFVLRSGTAQTVSSDPGAPGRLAAESTTINLGRVPFDQRAEARFVLGNTGGETVQLVGAPRVRMLEGC